MIPCTWCSVKDHIFNLASHSWYSIRPGIIFYTMFCSHCALPPNQQINIYCSPTVFQELYQIKYVSINLKDSLFHRSYWHRNIWFQCYMGISYIICIRTHWWRILAQVSQMTDSWRMNNSLSVKKGYEEGSCGRGKNRQMHSGVKQLTYRVYISHWKQFGTHRNWSSDRQVKDLKKLSRS